jgi:hypothetical protein
MLKMRIVLIPTAIASHSQLAHVLVSWPNNENHSHRYGLTMGIILTFMV